MQNKASPLSVIIDPPGVQPAMPGDTVELYIVITNQSDRGAVIDVFFDEASETLHQWSNSSRESLALGPQQSSELTFQFKIPTNTLPGTYDYTLVVDAPEHFPEDTPIQYPRQLKVMLKEHTVVRVNDPTFSLKPASNPRNPIILKSKEALQIEVMVDNRSNRVDRFRLVCSDLEDDWYAIRYPNTGVEGPGILAGTSGLELNPNTRGKILLELKPPVNTLAGSYSPTIRLYSANSPDLVLLDLVYIQIPPIHLLDVELYTLRGKISNSFGLYEIKLNNRGNTPRDLKLNIKSRDEEQLYKYECDPRKVRLFPNKSTKVNLTVKPRPWWRRPLFGSALSLNFQVSLQDKDEYPLPDKLPEGTLLWNSRPWWQFIPFFITLIGSIVGIAFLIWFFFLKPPSPAQLVAFSPDSINYIQGDEIRLDWQVSNFQQISKLEIDNQGQTNNQSQIPSAPQIFDFRKGIPNKLNNICQAQLKYLTCSNYDTGVTQPGSYTFTLKLYTQGQNKPSSTESITVKINEKPAARVGSFQLDKSQYTSGDTILLSWTIQNPDQLAQLKITGKSDSGSENVLATYTNDQLKKSCQLTSQLLTCTKISLKTPEPGKYTFALQAFSQSGQPPNSYQIESTINILPKPLQIVFFTLNGSQEPNIVLQPNEPVVLQWEVEGEDISVQLTPFGTVASEGSLNLVANEALPNTIQLTATDKFGHSNSKGFSVKVSTPTPLPSPAPFMPLPRFNRF
ncbi:MULTISPECIES: hypothetical protein [Nostocales]|uniref:Uncharacterized protein n=4 Tax=Nostocales TaxID=1161 RepID=A0A8S9TCB0_9CYAN|nr:hypothetical protein [Tolypothrix bouteillei]KAF3889252.1 hypothetical protein DA73_0400030040 [Tolypothrix bouteillei VB521301]